MRPVKNQSDFLDRSPDDDPVFDSLLNEALGGPPPPDQAEQILERIDLHSAAASSTATPSLSKTAATTGNRRTLLAWSTLLAAAASLAWIALTASPFEAPDGPSIAQTEPHDSEIEQTTIDHAPPGDRERGSDAPAQDATTEQNALLASSDPQELSDAATMENGGPLREGERRRPVPMEMSNVPFGSEVAVADEPSPSAVPVMPESPERQTGSAIVGQIDAHLANAWDALSLARAEAAEAAEITERFERTIAVAVAPEEFNVPEQLIGYIAASEGRTNLSHALLDELLGPSAASRLSSEQRSVLTAWVASAFGGERGFDDVITALYQGGENERTANASQAWLTALAGGQSVPVTEQTARALLDLDLRCSRCHEHPIERGIGQQDYWQFVALFNSGLYYTQSEDGRPEARLKEIGSNPSEGIFFELPDGRQRVALPGVSPEWFGVPGGPSIDRLSLLSRYWGDNPQLAKSTVNRLWKIIYGRPLVGSASDPGAPPRDEHLAELRDYLAEQLRAYDFDLAAATSWILAAEPMRLRAASAMSSEKLLTASTEERVQADYETRAFAAYQPLERRESFAALIAMADRWNGGTAIDSPPGGSTLAQPIDSGSGRPEDQADADASRFRQQWLRASFPAVSTVTNERPDLPAQWLRSLKTFEQQARHLYYAAGYWRPHRSQMQAAERLRNSSDDPDLALSQLWWALEHGAEQ